MKISLGFKSLTLILMAIYFFFGIALSLSINTPYFDSMPLFMLFAGIVICIGVLYSDMIAITLSLIVSTVLFWGALVMRPYVYATPRTDFTSFWIFKISISVVLLFYVFFHIQHIYKYLQKNTKESSEGKK